MNKIVCPCITVLPPEAVDLFRIYEVPKNVIAQLYEINVEYITTET